MEAIKIKSKVLPLLIISLFLIPLVTAQEDDNKPVLYFIAADDWFHEAYHTFKPGQGNRANAIAWASHRDDGVEFDRFLEGEGLDGGWDNPYFEKVRKEEFNVGGADQMMFRWRANREKRKIKEITGVDVEIRILPEQIESDDSLWKAEDIWMELLAKHGYKFDPSKDKIIEFSGKVNKKALAYTYFEHEGVRVYKDAEEFTLTHELHHAGFGDLHFYCDTYNYKAYEDAKSQMKILFDGQECVNEYDPQQCCFNNPIWFDVTAGPDGTVVRTFKETEYSQHIEANKLGWNCVPRKGQENPECLKTLERQWENTKKGFPPLCLGQPVDKSDPGPPYSRDVMATHPQNRIIHDCFEEQYQKRTVRPVDQSAQQ